MKKVFKAFNGLFLRLQLVLLSLLFSSSLLAISVKFSVDLTYQITNGTFNSSTDKVYVRGDFNNWNLTNPMSRELDGIYSTTLQLSSLTLYEFKFFTDAAGVPNSGWEVNVGAGRDNRIMSIVEDADIDLGKVYFNNANLKLRESGVEYEFYCADPDTQYITPYAKYLDENLPRIVNMLETTVKSKVKIWVYPDRKSFMLAFGSPAGPDWVGGSAFEGKEIIVLSPRIYGNGNIDLGLVGHEFVHIVVDWKKNSYVHAWLNEGAACFYSGEPGELLLRFDRQIKQLIETQYNGQMPELSKIESWDFADNGGYPLSTSIADFIITQFGESAFANFIVDTDYSTLGFASKSDFQNAWHKFLQDVYIDPIVTSRFSVDMSYSISKGLFNPSTDKVYIGGPWSSWFPFVMNAEGNGVYSYRLACQYNKEYQYKFKVNTTGGSNGGWENLTSGNRVVQTSSKDITLPIVAFNNQNPSLSIVSPNGGESFIEGDSATISWKYTTIPTIKIEYSTDNGINWSIINPTVPASALSMRWKVPSVSSSTMRIRLSDASNSAVNDISDSPFSVVVPNTVGGPYLADKNTVLLLHFENNLANSSTLSADGILNGTGSTFINESPLHSGQSFRFDGDDYVSIPQSPDLNLTGDWTIEMWFKLDEYTYGPYLINKPGDNDAYFSNYSLQTASWWDNVIYGFYFSQNSSRVGLSIPKPELKKWYHITYIRDSKRSLLKLLLHDENFKLISTLTQNYTETGVLTNSNPVIIGQGLIGDIDELRVSNVVRNFGSLSLTSPNGSEMLVAGSKTNVTWTSSDVEKVKLELTTNSGITWSTIASEIDAAAGSYSWTVPASYSSTCKIRISDQSNTTCNDLSDQSFTIIKPTVLSLTSPNGGESWKVGTTQSITWNSEEIANVKLEYSTDLGATWTTIINSVEASTHSYSFIVPNTIAYEWLIRITNNADVLQSNVSDARFITYNEIAASVSPLMSIEYPVFTWPYNAYFPVTTPADADIINGHVGNQCGPTAMANLMRYWEFPLKGTGSRTFVDREGLTWYADFGNTIYNYDRMPATVPQNATSEVYDAVATLMFHAGVGMFDIYRSGAQDGLVYALINYFNYSPKAKFIYRNDYTPEQWDKVFKSEFAQGRPIIIGGDGGPLPEGGVAGHWFICDGYNSENKYHIRWDYGENNDAYLPLYEFKPYHVNNWALVYLEPDLKGEQLALTSPSGYENWQQGTPKNIQWNSSNVNAVKIEYSTNNGYSWTTLASDIPAVGGSYSITVPAGTSKECKIRISDASDINVYSRNKIPFNVFESKELTLLPCIPGNLQPGSKFPIRWNSAGIENISIEFSTNNGTTWIGIADTVASIEKYNWLVPEINSSTCLIRVTDKTDVSNSSTSQVFSVSSLQYVGGPYSLDVNTVALLHFNGNYVNEANNEYNAIANNIVSFKEDYELGTDLGVLIENPSTNVFSNVEIPHYSTLTLGKDWTIELWFKINNWGSGTVSYPTLIAKNGMNYFINPDPVSKTIKAGYDHTAGREQISLPENSVQTNKWYHIAFFRNTTNTTINLILHDENRKLLSSVSAKYNTAGTPKGSTEALMIGGYHVNGNTQFDGYIDELRISKVAREFRILEFSDRLADEIFKVGEVKTLTWNVQDVKKINLFYSVDGSANWKKFASNIDAASKSYEWTVPNEASDQCLLKISDANDNNFYDLTDNFFTIGYPNAIWQLNTNGAFDINNVEVFPNPFRDELTFRCYATEPTKLTLLLIDCYGKLRKKLMIDERVEGDVTIPMNSFDLNSGIYWLLVQTDRTTKVVKVVHRE